jgi:peptide/nickel transport system permease protein
MMTVDSLLKSELSLRLDSLRHLVLPIFTLAFLSWALLMRIARSSLLSELQQDYVTTARSKGLAERAVRR